MIVTMNPYNYPAPKKNISITRSEYDALRELYRRISAERLAADASGPAETLAAIKRTDAVLGHLQAMYYSGPSSYLN